MKLRYPPRDGLNKAQEVFEENGRWWVRFETAFYHERGKDDAAAIRVTDWAEENNIEIAYHYRTIMMNNKADATLLFLQFS